ncbi:Protein of Unknown function (DUF2784) [Rheinheimera sp. A13L]|uniref:DUF2784 domain-containing protein n=1 Tax=Rheinheimera sp. A13L TaxID=506534 RepID=UPI0002124B89|nr:DUF2784 domain-containing protein [Rheinheimera sp. A13L]EGM79022.1 Protein of Unknown function (DUF2784) [Rheinheimera sp. A13L]
MSRELLLLVVADAILLVHVLFVCFVVFGLLAIYLGYFLNWLWVRNLAFRLLHLFAIGIVVLQSWLGVICPLTIWEMALRKEAGAVTYSGSFIQHWLHQLLFYTAPEWVFILLYSAFGLLVLASWFVVRPKGRSGKE